MTTPAAFNFTSFGSRPPSPTSVASPPLELHDGIDSDEELRRETQLQRERERLSRKKRLDKTKTMRAQVAALEQTALAMRVLPDSDAIWDEFLDDDTKRVRGALRRLVPVAAEVKRLVQEKAQLHRLIDERELARQAVAELMEEVKASDDWEANTKRWKALSKLHFRPLDISQCAMHIHNALTNMETFSKSRDRQTTGLTFMGWRDSRRLDVATSSLQFSLDKTYRGHDMDHCMNMMWRVYSEQELYSTLVMGGRARVSVDVLQQISPTIWVLRYAGAYDELPVIVHELYLFFRIETEDGVVQYLKSIQDSDLQSAFDKPTDVWTSNNFWVKWDVLDTTRQRSSTDYRVRVGGSLQGATTEYLNRWLFEVLATIMRLEVIGIGRPMLDFSE